MKKRILVVDDNELMRCLLRAWLERQGYEIETAQDGREGMMLLKKLNHFDLVITDFRMPKTNGIELIKWIRQKDQKIKIILLSGEDVRLVYSAAKNAGADEVISKNGDLRSEHISSAARELLAA